MLAASEKCQFSLRIHGQSNPKARALADTYGNVRFITTSHKMEAGLRADLQEQDARCLNIDSFGIAGILAGFLCVRVSVNLCSYLIVYIVLCTISL